VAAINQLGVGGSMTHMSTGGGASLELIEGAAMPGLRALAAGGPQQPAGP
jgi:phosphoglycerate kinase